MSRRFRGFTEASIGWSILLAQLWFMPAFARAQGSKEDYERSQSLQKRTSDKVFRDRVVPTWLNDGKQFWYEVKTGPDARQWVLVDVEKGQRSAAFDHARLAAALAKATGKEVQGENLPLGSLRLSGDLATAHFVALGKRWKCDLT